MATGTLAIQDESVAREWVAKCNANEKELHELIEQVGALLEYVGQHSEGDIVDKFIEFGTAVKKEAGMLFEAVSKVSQGVSSLIDVYKSARDGILGGLAKLAGIG
jgi:L-arabinose isomerase